MEITTIIIVSLIYLVAFIITFYLLKNDYFGYAAFAAPFLTYPAATVLAIIAIYALGEEFNFFDYVYYVLGGFAAYSVLSLIAVLVLVPQTTVHYIKVQGVKTNVTELNIFDEHARPTGEKIPVGVIMKNLSQMTFIKQYGKHHIAYVPDQYSKPYFYPRGLYMDPNYLQFKAKKNRKLERKRFTQNEKPAVIKEIQVSVEGLKEEVGQLTLLSKSGERSRKTIDREDFYDLLPTVAKVEISNGKAIVLIPVDGKWKRGIRVTSEHLVFNSKSDKKRIEKFLEYKKSFN